LKNNLSENSHLSLALNEFFIAQDILLNLLRTPFMGHPVMQFTLKPLFSILCLEGILMNTIQANPNPHTSFILQSSDFLQDHPIPKVHSCHGEGGRKNVSPALSWSSPPRGTKSFVLIMSDPDAPHGTWDHWILFNLPEETRNLPDGVQSLPNGARQGVNSWKTEGYGGPCPPSGTHRYFFELFALDRSLDLPEGSSKSTILAAMEKHVLGKAVLMGTFSA
jgi:Raf kinase inhibitor-like YbhB/YbcL family protein